MLIVFPCTYTVTPNASRAGFTGTQTRFGVRGDKLKILVFQIVRLPVEPAYLHLAKQCLAMGMGIRIVRLVSVRQTQTVFTRRQSAYFEL